MIDFHKRGFSVCSVLRPRIFAATLVSFGLSFATALQAAAVPPAQAVSAAATAPDGVAAVSLSKTPPAGGAASSPVAPSRPAVGQPSGTAPTPANSTLQATASPGRPEFKMVEGESAADLFTKIRDPFRKPERMNLGAPKSELERHAVEQYELLGIVTGPAKTRAMVRSPDKRTLVVGLGARIGTRNGVVRKITGDSLIVQEKILNVLGREENVDTELKIVTKIQKRQNGEPDGGN